MNYKLVAREDDSIHPPFKKRQIKMQTIEIFNQEKLNDMLDENYIFSADIICKVINSELSVGKSNLSDWLESLSDDEAIMLADYFCQLKEEEVYEREIEDVLISDLLFCLQILYFLECSTVGDFNEENVPDMLEHLDIVCNLDCSRRLGEIRVLEKAKMSDMDCGSFEIIKKPKKRKVKK